MVNKIECKKRKLKSFWFNTYTQNRFNLKKEQYISIDITHFGWDCQMCLFDLYSGKQNEVIPKILFGDNVNIIDRWYIFCMNEVRIWGRYLLWVHIFITDNYQRKQVLLKLIFLLLKDFYIVKSSKELVCIGYNIWIGRNVCVMPYVIKGSGCKTGVNAVFIHDIKNNCVVGECLQKSLENWLLIWINVFHIKNNDISFAEDFMIFMYIYNKIIYNINSN